jgi:hypothetical protein
VSRAESKTAMRLLARLVVEGEHDLAARRAEHWMRSARGKRDLNDRAKAAESVGVEPWQ